MYRQELHPVLTINIYRACSWIYRSELSGKAQAVVVVPVVGVVVAVSHTAVPLIVVPTTSTEKAIEIFLHFASPKWNLECLYLHY